MSHSILKIFRYVKYLLFSQLWYYETLNHMYTKEAVVKISLRNHIGNTDFWVQVFLVLLLLLCCVCWLSLCDHTLQSFGGFLVCCILHFSPLLHTKSKNFCDYISSAHCAAQPEQQLVLGTFLLITYSHFRSLGFCYIVSLLFLTKTFLHDFQKKVFICCRVCSLWSQWSLVRNL